mgnify:CR=1 FL=1
MERNYSQAEKHAEEIEALIDETNALVKSTKTNSEATLVYQNLIYQTVIQRNVRLSEAPSHGMPCVMYDKNCVGSKSYFKLAEEFMKNNKIESAA